MMVIRPIHQDDLKSLYRLAEKTGIGFTSLIADEGILQQKIDRGNEQDFFYRCLGPVFFR